MIIHSDYRKSQHAQIEMHLKDKISGKHQSVHCKSFCDIHNGVFSLDVGGGIGGSRFGVVRRHPLVLRWCSIPSTIGW